MALLPRSYCHAKAQCRRLFFSRHEPLSSARPLSVCHFSSSPYARKSQNSWAATILAEPSWSVRTLLSASSDTAAKAPDTAITPAQLHHLLRLSALPLPRDSAEEAKMISTLQSQLRFVRDVQRVDTAKTAPLRSIRDETRAAMLEQTIGTAQLEGALSQEESFGHRKRPRRRRSKIDASEAEDWDALKLASQSNGRYFVVRSGKN